MNHIGWIEECKEEAESDKEVSNMFILALCTYLTICLLYVYQVEFIHSVCVGVDGRLAKTIMIHKKEKLNWMCILQSPNKLNSATVSIMYNNKNY